MDKRSGKKKKKAKSEVKDAGVTPTVSTIISSKKPAQSNKK